MSERPVFHNLDLLRFVSAVIVVIFHLTLFFPDYLMSGGVYANMHYTVHSIAVLLFYGPAAVMVFFIVSGICIHAPYRKNQPIDVREFYTRRFIRIGIPLLAAWAYSSAVAGLCGSSVLPVWSLWCEMAYYLLYPVLLGLMRWCGFYVIFLLSITGAALLCSLSGVTYSGPGSYGPLQMWVIFLPVWLCGLWICECRNRPVLGFSTLSVSAITALSALTLFGVPACLTILQKLNIARTLPLIYVFCIFCVIYIALAIRVDLSRFAIVRMLERQGRWSYSLYLIHSPLIFFGTWVLMKGGFTRMHVAGLVASSFLVFMVSIGLSLVFYRFVEKPSHVLAKRLAVQFRRRLAPIDPVTGGVVE